MTPASVVAAARGRRDPVRKCGRPKRQGSKDPCGRGAGWGTPHPGYGACKLHGGNTPSGLKHAANEVAREFSVGMLGAEVEVSASEALEQSVRLAAGLTLYYRVRMTALGDDSSQSERDVVTSGFERAVERQNRLAKNALDAGIDERHMRVIEQESDRIVAAAEAAIAVVALTAAQRTLFAQTFARRLSMPGDVDGTAVEV